MGKAPPTTVAENVTGDPATTVAGTGALMVAVGGIGLTTMLRANGTGVFPGFDSVSVTGYVPATA